MKKILPAISTAILSCGCAVTLESENGDLHRFGLFWETTKADPAGAVQHKQLRTLGLGIDTSETTGGLVLGYKEWSVISLSGDSSVVVVDGKLDNLPAIPSNEP